MLQFHRIFSRLFCFCLLSIFSQSNLCAQALLGGSVKDNVGKALVGTSVSVVELKLATSADKDGNFSFTNVPAGRYTLQAKLLGYITQEKIVVVGSAPKTEHFVLNPNDEQLEEVVVMGYASVKKSDLTGAVSKVSAEDFNKGPITSPDQLIQGKASGVQMINNSGQPGGGSTVKIRGTSAVTGSGQPLYVVDGVALDGSNARPGAVGGELGTVPPSNPLAFINPNDIESMEVLKDASATAIYGSRAAYGVVLITTKRGKSGALRIDATLTGGVSSIMRKVDVLDGDQYREMLARYGLSLGDYGDNVDALDAILRDGFNTQSDVAFSGGSEDARFRASVGYQNQDGIVKTSNFEKFNGAFNGNFKMLESKKLGVDMGLVVNQVKERLAPITTNAGFYGSLIGQALSWNPTRSLYNPDGTLFIEQGSFMVNPLGMLGAYNDQSTVTNILGNFSPYYKVNDWLEYRMLGSIKYANGNRRTSTRSWINMLGIEGNANTRGGAASVGANEFTTTQMTHTLNFNKEIWDGLNLNAVAGYEYMRFENRGTFMSGREYGDIDVDYTDALQAGSQGSRSISSFNNPSSELQSYFFRAIFNYRSRYLLTGTIRRDGSTKFGVNNKYGNFPSFSAAWNIKEEAFLKNVSFLSDLKLRAGWGKTGNQEFPSGAAVDRYGYGLNGVLTSLNNGNPDLKWQSDEQTNIGVDFGLFNSRLTGTIDLFSKQTTDLLYPRVPYYPNSPGTAIVWTNLEGVIQNRGVELALQGKLIQTDEISWNIGGNLTLLRNRVRDLEGSYNTGLLNGQGLSNTTIEVVRSGLPMFAMFTRDYLGLDANGFSEYADEGYTYYYVGNPNPKALVGFSTDISYKGFSLVANFNGTLGNDIYNETENAVLAIGNLGTRNISRSYYDSGQMESFANPIAPSSRYIEDGSYIKLANATLSYRVGDLGANIKNLNVFVTGTNLLLFTKYSGFDAEINVEKSVGGLPSAGIDYIAYPSSRTFNLGIGFSL
ncbi:SusC/RagA family TonB-linked outer membrane protein [Sphingobacterium deserti]|uniref:TonB-dependent receptor plug n=1 Tax=Sphingobacterium deserti TaxID=1229276 RepID=A0A0B8T6L1_9SPHI|nr:SusC/RagA family TonB-linked outer membrane protein [Sphingobacterium deserti]KGE12945.1 TonB-dependent receptor plug [Sphingobacterium deserti]